MNDYLEHNNLKNLKEDKEIERKIQLILRVGKVLMESGIFHMQKILVFV